MTRFLITVYVTDCREQTWEKFQFRSFKRMKEFLDEGITWEQTETVTIQIEEKGKRK